MAERIIGITDFRKICGIIVNEETTSGGIKNTVSISLKTPLPEQVLEKSKMSAEKLKKLREMQNKITTQRVGGYCSACPIKEICERSKVFTQSPTQHTIFARVTGMDIKPIPLKLVNTKSVPA